MIVPSIDLRGGNAVQLVGGEELALDAGDPLAVAERFARVGELAVIDLDRALGTGDNRALVEELCRLYPCRVGGGLRDLEACTRALDAGAEKILIGTAAEPELLARLPRERVLVALDARHDEVVVDGWRTRTGRRIEERMRELSPWCSGFLVTFVEREGRLGGTRLDRVRDLCAAAGDARVTIAGGVTRASEVRELDRLGCDAQVGMALYSGRLDLTEAFAAPLSSDRSDGLWPTVVCDERGVCLGLAYSDLESLRASVERGRGIYHSRRHGLWEKGATSGDVQELIAVGVDCDRDALRFTVRQHGAGFCHEGTRTCFGAERGPEFDLGALERTLLARAASAPADSYVARLLREPGLLRAKLEEEMAELVAARTRGELKHEAADVLFFVLTRLVRDGVSLREVELELARRGRRVTRRTGDAKEGAR